MRSTPSESCRTDSGTTPAVTPIALSPTSAAAAQTPVGTAALPTFALSTVAKSPPESVIPLAVSRSANVRRAAASRLASVAGGSFNCRAASRCVSPSRSQSTTGNRSLSGKAASSASKIGWMSAHNSTGDAARSGMASTCFSRERRLNNPPRALRAVRYATPNNQLASCPRGFTAAARRASTTKTAWKASSAVWVWPMTRRQTP